MLHFCSRTAFPWSRFKNGWDIATSRPPPTSMHIWTTIPNCPLRTLWWTDWAVLCRQSNNPPGVLQVTKPIRRYIMGSNHSFIGGLGENYAALGENWHINFQSPSLKKTKRKAYKRLKTACRLNFFGAAGGIRTLVGLLPNWFRVCCSKTTLQDFRELYRKIL